MKVKATEHFKFGPVGPYTISKIEEEKIILLEENISVKREAISRARKYLDNGMFTKIQVTDSTNQIIFEKEKTSGQRFFKEDIRFNALVRILLNSDKLTQEVRNQTCHMLAKEFSGSLSIVAGETWNEIEDESLKFLYCELGLQDMKMLSYILNRSESSVTHRVKRTNLVPKTVKRVALFG